ncbi:HNH endonuclease [Erwinia psidii]|uniref:Putative HNH nuclease YajD n=1 Tax=Erwinia psidii TaxID=69224 RepID=A0A3N6SE35_9GAMM|nr:HNH endonuclease [Erwinia psidii]MCX8959436.1 HNH endonuclease [Erwinia psidii]MCX8962742.1 HNH endonuclease [Erwinia psidii]MCX8964288.1 HNH endonuclease [Erwinia psidii]RQM36881.1 HNH endonuclease [Erwinia psidii]
MPWQPLRRCTEPGCNVRVKAGKCDEHKREERRQSDSRRGTRTQRGYSNRWGEYRRLFLKANPLCVHCLKAGDYTPATIVDHIIPINGEGDVLFWPASNHQALCQTHHNRKTVQVDPMTKQKRMAGAFHKQEEAARLRNHWIYDYGDE